VANAAHDAWQAEADLLADGRALVEDLCNSARYRHLYPEGANLRLLLDAYGELDRFRTSHRRAAHPRRDARRLRRNIKNAVRADALARSRRLTYGHPPPRRHRFEAQTPALVDEALAQVDADVRDQIESLVRGRSLSEGSALHVVNLEDSIRRGRKQFAQALLNAAMAAPALIGSLHPQFTAFVQSPPPQVKRHPLATFLLVKLPLQLLLLVGILFNVVYLSAYFVFNDARLGQFLTTVLDPMLDGRLEFESVHWRPTLIVDLFTGRPHHLTAKGVQVYESFKSTGDTEPTTRLIGVDEISANLVLHEIIPWNRIGVPNLVEIPWVLHITEAEATGAQSARLRRYQPEGSDFEVFNLVHAFQTMQDRPNPDMKPLSYRVDSAVFTALELQLDFPTQGWGADVALGPTDLALVFDAPDPKLPVPERIPFVYRVQNEGIDGSLSLLGQDMRMDEFRHLDISSGVDGLPLGDLRMRADGNFEGSPSHVDAILRDALGLEPGVRMRLTSSDAADLANLFLPQPEDAKRPVASGSHVHAQLLVEGPLDDPDLRIAAEGVTLDLFPTEPAWAFDDVDISLRLAQDPIPELWSAEIPHAIGDKRWVVYVESLRAAGLDGELRRRGRGKVDHFVVPEDGEPLVASMHLELDGINLGQLTPDDPELADTLRGSADGEAHLKKLVLGEDIEHLMVDLPWLRTTRDRGPADDSLPRQIRAEGSFSYRPERGVDLGGLALSTGGAKLLIDGALDGEFQRLRPTQLSLDIDDGRAFADAFGIEPYFEVLSARLGLEGLVFSPTGRGGRLSVGAGTNSRLPLKRISNADLSIDRGRLKIKAKNISVLGGHGDLEIVVVVSRNNKILEDPLVYLGVHLEDIEQRSILGAAMDVSGGTLDFRVDDGHGNPVPLSEWHASGDAQAERATIYGVPYRVPTAKFSLSAKGVDFEAIELEYHRPVSPHHEPGATIPVGQLSAVGHVGFEVDPVLDLKVDVSGLPLTALTRIVDEDLPVQGSLGAGSSLRFKGTASRPAVDGTLRLAHLAASGVPLGDGDIVFSSIDVRPRAGSREGTSARAGQHRELRIEGAFANTRPGAGGTDTLSWDLRGLIAFGPENAAGRPPSTEMELDMEFQHLPADKLLAHPSRKEWRSHVVGQLDDLRISALYCPPGRHYLTSCEAATGVSAKDPWTVDLSLGHLWLLAGDAQTHLGDHATQSVGARRRLACSDPTALCSTDTLLAQLEGTVLTLRQPWNLRSGGKADASLAIAGKYDLGGDEATGEAICHLDNPEAADHRATGSTQGQIDGELELSALNSILVPFGVKSPQGRVEIKLNLAGSAVSPRVDGSVRLPQGSRPIDLRFNPQQGDEEVGESPDLTFVLPELAFDIDRGIIGISGRATVNGAPIGFGKRGSRQSYVSLAGPCSGRFALAGEGVIDGDVPRAYFPELLKASEGDIGLERFFASGQLRDAEEGSYEAVPLLDQFETLEGRLSFNGHRLDADLDFERFIFNAGVVDFRICDGERRCGGSGARLGVFIGGERSAQAASAPSDALSLLVGLRAGTQIHTSTDHRAQIWGEVDLPAALDRLAHAKLRAQANQVPFGIDDHSGRAEIDASLSSTDLRFDASDTGYMRLSGDLLVERSRWLRDVQQGAAVLSFEDPAPDTSEPFPESIRDIELDLSLRSTAPVRSDINILERFEADAEFSVGGTLEEPEVSGVLDVERGILDIDILGAPFEIERGRVVLGSEVATSSLDMLAVRQEPVKIGDQEEYITLRLHGPLDRIAWECSAVGDTSGQLSTAGGCLDYLIFDAGNQLAVTDGVTRAGGTGTVVDQGRKAVAVIGNLTQVELNDLLQDELPRLEEYLPILRVRPGRLGAEVEVESRSEWLNWGWGRVGFGYGYVRGYPGTYLRDAQELRLRLEVLENTALEGSFGLRNYANRALILDPPRYGALELLHRLQVPSGR
jgi:hypothetical protein